MTEADLQLHICQYLRLQYPNILFRSDFASGVKLTIGQARRHASLQSGRGWPDLILYDPRGKYVGLALELKRDGTKLYTLAGKPTSPHIQEQHTILDALAIRGWCAEFSIGFDTTKERIDWYLALPSRL